MVDDRRRNSRQPMLQGEVGVEDTSADWGDVEEDAFALLSHESVRELLGVLSPDQRDVVLLRVVADLSVEEVARLLGKREGDEVTVRRPKGDGLYTIVGVRYPGQTRE